MEIRKKTKPKRPTENGSRKIDDRKWTTENGREKLADKMGDKMVDKLAPRLPGGDGLEVCARGLSTSVARQTAG